MNTFGSADHLQRELIPDINTCTQDLILRESAYKIWSICLSANWFFLRTVQGYHKLWKGAEWLSGRVLDSRPRDPRFESHQRHCALVLEQDTFILA